MPVELNKSQTWITSKQMPNYTAIQTLSFYTTEFKFA